MNEMTLTEANELQDKVKQANLWFCVALMFALGLVATIVGVSPIAFNLLFLAGFLAPLMYAVGLLHEVAKPAIDQAQAVVAAATETDVSKDA